MPNSHSDDFFVLSSFLIDRMIEEHEEHFSPDSSVVRLSID